MKTTADWKSALHQYMPPGGIGGVFFSSGFSTIVASVISNNAATDEAFCNATRVTLVGSMTPAFSKSPSPLVIVTSHNGMQNNFNHVVDAILRSPSVGGREFEGKHLI